MSDPETSDRERLLRLIDGGPEAVREMQRQRDAEAPKPQLPSELKTAPMSAAPVVPVAPSPRKIVLAEAQKVRLAQAVLAAALVAFAVYFISGAIQTRTQAPVAQPAAPAVSGADSLRLVGVDWAEPRPVALLEDRVSGKTYFVKKGDTALGAKVTDVQKDRVTVIHRGRAVELR